MDRASDYGSEGCRFDSGRAHQLTPGHRYILNCVSTNSNRIESIQGLRALAVMLVVLFHATNVVSRGFIGVDVFFVISGFVITGLIIRSINETGTFSLKSFWVRRFFRIVPALATMLAAVLGLSLLFESWHLEQRRTQVSAISALFSFSNWKYATDKIGYFNLDNASNPLLHTWSLGVEEQFYLFFPLLVLGAIWTIKRTQHARKLVFLASWCAIFLSIAVQIYYSRITPSSNSQKLAILKLLANIGTPFYGSPSRIWEFMAGSMAYLNLKQFRKIPMPLHRVGQLVLPFVLVIVSLNEGVSVSRRLVLLYLFVVVVTVLTLTSCVICAESNQRQAILQNKLMIWVGDRSYGWYLWHMPLIVFCQKLFPGNHLAGAIGAFIALIIAAVSYHFIETKVRDQKGAIGPKRSILAIGSIAATVLMFVFGFFIATPLLERAAGTANPKFDNCDPYTVPCIRNQNAVNTKVILLEGDSHAASISGVITEAAINSNQNLVICLRECLSRFGLESLIQRYKITTVVSMRQYPSIPSAGYEAIEDLAKRNPVITVVLIADNPSFEGWNAPAIFGPKSIPEKRDDVEASQFGALNRLTQLDRDLENVRLVPVLDLLCGAVNCETEIDGRIVYSDDNHLSAFGAQLLAHRINSALTSTP